MKFTPRLGFPLWDEADALRRTDFNRIGTAEAKLLSPNTAAAYGLGATATPDNVLEKLNKSVLFQSGFLKTVLGANVTIPATQLSERVKIVAGAYVGTGTFGASNPNKIYCGFEPKQVMLFNKRGLGLVDYSGICPWGFFIWIKGVRSQTVYDGYAQLKFDISFNSDALSLSWFSGSAYSQFNRLGEEWYYVAIG